MSPLTLKLLGVFQLIDGENTITLEQARLPELLAYLALRRFEAVPRRQLAFLLWPDSSEAQAQTNLRNLLFKLGKAWPTVSDFLHVERSRIRWHAETAVEIDVLRFEAAVAQADAASQLPAVESALQEALSCYGGDLLPSCYDDWILIERERLDTIFIHTLERLALLLEDQRRYDEAIVQAQRLLQADPLQENSYRHLMRLYAATGDRAAALRTYHTCLSLLERELAAPPGAATQELYTRLLNLDQSAPGQPSTLAQNTPMVGRQHEWKQLLSTWREANQGRAQLVVIRGEAGIGKTRLAEELVDRVAHQGYSVAGSRAYAAEGALSYAPVSEWLRRKPIRRFVEKVEPIWQVEIARLLPEILHKHPELPAPGPLSEGWQRQRFFEGVVRLFLALPQPLLLHLDDLQWCDEETLTLLHYLLRSARTARLLLVGTVRSEEVDASHPLSRVLAMLRQDDLLREIELGPLSAEDSATLATQTSGEAIPAAMQEDLYRESEGHPLFLIEMIRMQDADRERSTADRRPRTASSLPPKIQTVIGARLEQLSALARELAQVAAVVGREFSFPLLLAASSADEEALVMALDELWRRRIVREQADGYDFSHDRIREVAYGEISRVRRRFLHRRVASALESLYAGEVAAVYAQIAVHYQEAGEKERAQHYHKRAAEHAMDRFASEEAQRHLLAALDLTPEGDMEDRFDLLVLLQRVYAWQSQLVKWGVVLDSIEVQAEKLDDDRRRAQCAVYRAEWSSKQGRPDERNRKAQEAIALAERSDATDILALAYTQWGSSLWDVSRFAEARPLLQKGAQLARQEGLPVEEEKALELLAALGMFTGMSATEIQQALDRCWTIAQQQGNLPCITSLCNKFGYLPVAQGEGQYDEARRWYNQAINLSQSMGDVGSISQCLANLIVLETVHGDYAAGVACSQEYFALHQGAMTPLNRGRYLNYWSDLLTNVGMFVVARRQQLESLDVLTQHGLRHFAVKTLVELAWLQHLMGDDAAALITVSEAWDVVTVTGDTRYQAISLTRQGYARHSLGDLDAAATAYQQGYALHRQMGQYNRSMAPLAGLARIAVEHGDMSQATQIAGQLWAHLQSYTLDRTIEGCRVYLTCYRILQAVDDPRAAWVLQTAWEQLQRRAATIDDPEWRHNFWQVADHQAVVEALSEARLSGPSPSSI